VRGLLRKIVQVGQKKFRQFLGRHLNLPLSTDDHG
jgi:hypothetical protein